MRFDLCRKDYAMSNYNLLEGHFDEVLDSDRLKSHLA